MGSPLGVYFMDVGQGDCSFVVPPDGAGAILFDCNDAHVADRFVVDHGITHLSAVVASHLDATISAASSPSWKDSCTAAARSTGSTSAWMGSRRND